MSRCAWMLSGLLLACLPLAGMQRVHAAVPAAVPAAPVFRPLGVADGLPSSSVNAIAQDRAGYLWIATADGLARYDGLGFRAWRHDPADPGSLPGNNVQALHVDAQDRVWVATESGGLSVLDAQRRGFRHFRSAGHPRIGSDDTWAIASRAEVLWFGTWGGGLHRLDPDGRITRFMPQPHDPHSLPAANILALVFDHDGTLWIGTTRGLARWDGDGFVRMPMPGAANAVVYAIAVDDGGVWVGTDTGLHRWRDGRWDDPPWAARFARPHAALALARDRDGTLWIGSQSGAWRVEAGDRLRAVPLGANAPMAVRALLVDRDGALWASLPGAGVGYLRADWRRRAQVDGDSAAAGARWRAVAAAHAGGFWLAGVGAAPVRLDAAGKLHRLPRAARGAFQGMHVRALVESAGSVLWAGSRDRLLRIDLRDGGAVSGWRPGAGADDLPGGVDLLRVAPDASLWLASAGAGVQQRDARGAVLRDWRAGTHGLGSADIEALVFAPGGGTWLAGEGGVSRLAPGADAFVPVPAMGRGRVYALAFDGADDAWLSRPTGLEHFRRANGHWTRVAAAGVDAGIPAVEAAGLVVDRAHRPWLSTSRGLFRWNPGRRRCRRFGVEDGLASQEFVPRGIASAKDTLAAVTRRGGVVLFDTTVQPRLHARRDLQLADVAIRDAGHWRSLNEPTLRLAPDAAELRVRMRLLAYADPAATRYESWLEGDNRGWLANEGGERIVAALSPGRYALHLRATDVDGNRSPERILHWQVLPPWWRTPPALAAWAVLASGLLALVVAALRWRLHARRRMRRLEQRRALAEEASRAKSRFLADLGHEVRTPMTGVLGMSELLLDDRLEPRQRRRVEAIRSAGRHLLRLLDDALDLARIEAGKLRLDPQPFAVRALVAEVAALQAPLARDRGLRFEVAVAPAVPVACRGDALRLKQVLFNLLGNAIKFTREGEVALRVEPLGGHLLRFSVRDTGPGLAPGQHPRLFGRFEQGDGLTDEARQAGCGLGLAICRELVLAMGGAIRVAGAPGRGTCFDVDVPLEPLPG